MGDNADHCLHCGAALSDFEAKHPKDNDDMDPSRFVCTQCGRPASGQCRGKVMGFNTDIGCFQFICPDCSVRIVTKDPRTSETTLKGVLCAKCADDFLEFLNRIKGIKSDLIRLETSKKKGNEEDEREG